MKLLYKILFFIFVTNLFSCKTSITFNEPQPVGIKNLSTLPQSLKGQYFSCSDSSTLLVESKIIQRIYDFNFKIHKNQLDSNQVLIGDTLIDNQTKERTLIICNGDSLIIHLHYIDTLFQLNYDNPVRKFKGYYFLNINHDKVGWEVKKIYLKKGQLKISSVSTKQDLEILKEIIESPIDTVPPYKFTVSKKQFKKFIKSNGFSDEELFIRK